MPDFELNASNGFSVIFVSGSTPVTGLTASDVTIHYSLNGGSATSYSLPAGDFTEVGADMEGIYFVTIDSSVFSSEGEIVFELEASGADRYLVRGEIQETSNINVTITDIKNTVDDIQTRTQTIKDDVREVQGTGFTEGDDSLTAQSSRFDTRVPGEVAQKAQLVDGTGAGQAPTDVGIWDVLGDGSTSIPDLGTKLTRVLGLSQENYRIFDQTYDSNDNLTSATVRIYENQTDTLNDQNHIAEYQVDADYSAANRLVDYRMYET